MLKTIVVRAMLLAGLWWTLAGGAADAQGAGIIVIPLALATTLYLHPRPYSISLFRIPAFLLFFVRQSIKGGVQVAVIAFRPRLRLRPTVLEIPLRLPRESEQIFLAAIMSLFPGTLSISLDGSCLQLHALDAALPIESEVRNAELAVARLFGAELP